MIEPVSAARTAREGLARGLAALQTPGVPPNLLGAAEPIALAMGALHQIESSQGAALAQVAAGALDAARRALNMLQAQAHEHMAVAQATEAVASSLGLVHQLAQRAAQIQAAPAAQASAFAGTMMAEAAPSVAIPSTQPSPAAWGQPPGYPTQQGAPQAVPQQAQQYVPQQAQPHPQQPHPQQAYAPQQAYVPAPAPQQAAPQQAPAQQASAQQAWQPPAGAAAAPAAAMAGGVLRIEAELGAHSATNFYKGLSGNDVIDSGGIFVATYQIPEIGHQLSIKVSMPGGYEFEAHGVVRWTREAPLSGVGVDAPPGFGAQFTDISPEGRQLVYRYVRNREPLFHDDL